MNRRASLMVLLLPVCKPLRLFAATTAAAAPDKIPIDSADAASAAISARLDLAKHVLSLILTEATLRSFLNAENVTFDQSDTQAKLNHRLGAVDLYIAGLVKNGKQ